MHQINSEFLPNLFVGWLLDWFDGITFNLFSCFSSRSLLLLQQFLLNIFQYLQSTKPDTKNIQKPVNWHILASEWEQPLYKAPLSRSLTTLLPEDAKKSSFWNTVFCLEYQMVDKICVQNDSNPKCHQNTSALKEHKSLHSITHTIIDVRAGSQS